MPAASAAPILSIVSELVGLTAEAVDAKRKRKSAEILAAARKAFSAWEEEILSFDEEIEAHNADADARLAKLPASTHAVVETAPPPDMARVRYRGGNVFLVPRVILPNNPDLTEEP